MTALTVAVSRPESGRPGTTLVVGLHGRGADETSLLPLAGHLGADVTLAAPRGPVPLGGGAHTWFANRGIGRPLPASIAASGDLLLEWLEGVADEHAKVVLLGFSGGMAMAGALLLREPERFAGSVLLSGTLPWDAGLDTSAGRLAGRRVFHGFDPADDVIPADLTARTRAWLRADSGADYAERPYPGAGHGLTASELADVAAFVRES